MYENGSTLLQGSEIRYADSAKQVPSGARQNRQARAGINFTKPCTSLFPSSVHLIETEYNTKVVILITLILLSKRKLVLHTYIIIYVFNFFLNAIHTQDKCHTLVLGKN